MDAGYVIYDGTPRACGNCDAGRYFTESGGKQLRHVPRSELDPMTLPPGGDVMVTEMKRRAAGLPVGVIGSDVVVRASIAETPHVHDLVRVVDDLLRDVPGAAERATAVLGGLPEWAIPEDVAARDQESPDDSGDEPPAELALVGSASPKSSRPRGRRQQSSSAAHPAAPLEPPADE